MGDRGRRPARRGTRGDPGLPQAIPLIESLREGESISPEGLESGFEYGFVITFPSAVARDTYLDHPAHLPVADRIRSAAEDVLVFDIET